MSTQNKQHEQMRKSAVKTSEMDTSHLDEKEVEDASYHDTNWHESEKDIQNEKEKNEWDFNQPSLTPNHTTEYLNDAGPDSTLDTDGKTTDARKDNHIRSIHTIHSNASMEDAFYDDNSDPLAGFDSRVGGNKPLLSLDSEHEVNFYYVPEGKVREVDKLSSDEKEKIKTNHYPLNHESDIEMINQNKNTTSGHYFILEKHKSD